MKPAGTSQRADLDYKRNYPQSSVNQRLRDMQVEFIELKEGQKDFAVVAAGDVVILPAFGASVQEMQLLSALDCKIVDTTCPWVSKVWNTVESTKR
jgi:4-hydroxy-3-methylbut-2-enyl diphosphate reductase